MLLPSYNVFLNRTVGATLNEDVVVSSSVGVAVVVFLGFLMGYFAQSRGTFGKVLRVGRAVVFGTESGEPPKIGLDFVGVFLFGILVVVIFVFWTSLSSNAFGAVFVVGYGVGGRTGAIMFRTRDRYGSQVKVV